MLLSAFSFLPPIRFLQQSGCFIGSGAVWGLHARPHPREDLFRSTEQSESLHLELYKLYSWFRAETRHEGRFTLLLRMDQIGLNPTDSEIRAQSVVYIAS